MLIWGARAALLQLSLVGPLHGEPNVCVALFYARELDHAADASACLYATCRGCVAHTSTRNRMAQTQGSIHSTLYCAYCGGVFVENRRHPPAAMRDRLRGEH